MVWSLKLCENPKCDGNHEPRFLKATLSHPVPKSEELWRNVVFADYGVAIRLAHWMRTHPASRPLNTDHQFNYPVDSDKTTYVSLVPFKTTKDECKPESEEQVASR